MFLLAAPTARCSASLEVLVPQGGMLPPGDTELELTLPPGYHGLLMPRNRQAKQGVPVQVGVPSPDPYSTLEAGRGMPHCLRFSGEPQSTHT